MLTLLLQTRKAGEAADPRKPAGETSDISLAKARQVANGKVRA